MLSNNKNTVWQDEEAGLLMVDQNLFSKSASPETVPYISTFCHWTSEQHNYFIKLYPDESILQKLLFSVSIDRYFYHLESIQIILSPIFQMGFLTNKQK